MESGEGYVEGFFSLLYNKDSNLRTCPGILLPPTVVFKFQQPGAWYYSSISTGQLMKRRKTSTSNAAIYDAFAANTVKENGVAAYHICNVEKRRPPLPANSPTPVPLQADTAEDDSEPTVDGVQRGEIEHNTILQYFGKRELWDFIFNDVKANDGCLQKFVQPKGASNAIIQATWSPKMFNIERRVNTKPLSETRLDKYERVVTYEGRELNSETAPLKSIALNLRFYKICTGIARHVFESSPNRIKIKRMKLYFKVDPNNRIWLLWCGSLRTFNEMVGVEKPLGPGSAVELHVPNHVKLSNSFSVNHPVMMQCTFKCPSCSSSLESDRTVDVAYQVIINFYRKFRFESVPADVLKAKWRLQQYRKVAAVSIQSAWRGFTFRRKLVAMGKVYKKRQNQGTRKNYLVKTMIGRCKIPTVFRNLHPHVNAKQYFTLTKSPQFYYKHATICDLCALKFTDGIKKAEVELFANRSAACRIIDEDVPISMGREVQRAECIFKELDELRGTTKNRQKDPDKTALHFSRSVFNLLTPLEVKFPKIRAPAGEQRKSPSPQ